jgi:hypothetical protein
MFTLILGGSSTEVRAQLDTDNVTSEDSAAVAASAVPQRDVMDLLNEWIFGKRVEAKLEGSSKSGLRWSILPTVSYNPVFGFAIGASASGAGRFGSGPRSRPSAVSVSANYSTKGQTQFLVRAETASPSGTYLTKVDFRYLDTERDTWGLGPIVNGQQAYPMHYELHRAYATFYRRTSGPVYVGLGVHLDHFIHIDDKRAARGEVTPFVLYSGQDVTSTRAAGVSLNLLADTRDSIVNPMNGYYLSGSFRTYMEDIGADRNWQEFWVAVQMYPRIPASS